MPLPRRGLLRGTILALAVAALTAGGGRADDGDEPKNQRVRAKLDQPVTMDFHDAPLQDVLKFVKSATSGPNDAGLPIYVDPNELEKAGRTIQSRVTIRAGSLVPLKISLREGLNALGLDYKVERGLLQVVARRAKTK